METRIDAEIAVAPVSSRSTRAVAGRWLVPIVISAVLAVWQLSFNSASLESRRAYSMSASMGLCADAPHFFYFFHHFGVFPVAALEVPRLRPSRQAATEFVAQHGDRLKMDFGWPTNTPRFGDYGKLFLFYPDLLLRGDPARPSAIPFNELLFIASLLALFWAFWAEGYPRLGALIAILVGSNPFQIVETYGRGNVFSIPISVALLALAAHLRFLTGRRGIDRPAWVIAIASGVALATIREVRAEAAFIGVSVATTYLLIRAAPLRKRLLLLAVFVVASLITGQAWKSYWTIKFSQAEQFVARAGGEVFRARPGTHHAFWHAMFCGLGDYGGDRGFSWDDRVAFRWATTHDPATNPRPIPYHYVRGYYLEETYDGVHHIAPTDLPEYNRLVRTRVLNEVRHHPQWYLGILWKRAMAIMRHATPASLSLGSTSLSLPGAGWLLIPILLVMLWKRRFFAVKLILFTLPLSAVALMVYSGKGMTFYGLAHLFALATCIDLLVSSGRSAVHDRRSHVF